MAFIKNKEEGMNQKVVGALFGAGMTLAVVAAIRKAYQLGRTDGLTEAEEKKALVLPVNTETVRDAEPKQKEKVSATKLAWQLLRGAKRSSAVRNLITNPEDHSAYAYVEDGMIKIEIRNLR